MTRLHKLVALSALAVMAAGPALAQLPPPDLSSFNATVQQQNLGTQLNNLQLQQNLTRDRIRELDLFRPQTPYGSTTVFLPQPPGLTLTPALPDLPPPPAPPPPKPPAPKAP